MAIPDPWLVDVILPEQWTHRLGGFDPNRLLRIAVLESALKDLRLPHQPLHRCLGCDVILWMVAGPGRNAFSFEDVCACLGLSTDGVLRGVRIHILPHLPRSCTSRDATLDFGPDASRAVS